MTHEEAEAALQAREVEWEAIVGPEPTREFALDLAEQCGALLRRLLGEALWAVALRKLEGQTNEEIAAELGCNVRTVERKLRVIRTVWGADGRPP